MGKNKLSRFAENATFDHVVQPSFTELQAADLPQKGKWNSDFFKRDALLVLELGCGGGEYTVGLAQLRPEKNYSSSVKHRWCWNWVAVLGSTP